MNLLDLPLVDSYTVPGVMPGLDWDMALAGTANWATGSSTIAKIVGPDVGTQAIRCTATAGGGFFYHIASFVVGGRYTMSFKYRSNAGKVIRVLNPSSSLLMTLTNSAAWTSVTISWVCVDTTVGFYMDMSGSLAGESFDVGPITIQTDLVSTKNLGSLGGSCQLGDGLTPATFPTFIGGGKRGVNTPGAGINNVGIQHPTFPAMGTAGTFFGTFYVSPLTISEASPHIFAIQGLVHTGYPTGWMLWQNASALNVAWGGAGSVIISTITPGVHSICITNDGALVKMYVDGALSGVPAAPSGPSNNTGLGIGYVANAGYSALHGCRIYDAKDYSYALSQTQILALTQRSLARINLF